MNQYLRPPVLPDELPGKTGDLCVDLCVVVQAFLAAPCFPHLSRLRRLQLVRMGPLHLLDPDLGMCPVFEKVFERD